MYIYSVFPKCPYKILGEIGHITSIKKYTETQDFKRHFNPLRAMRFLVLLANVGVTFESSIFNKEFFVLMLV